MIPKHDMREHSSSYKAIFCPFQRFGGFANVGGLSTCSRSKLTFSISDIFLIPFLESSLFSCPALAILPETVIVRRVGGLSVRRSCSKKMFRKTAENVPTLRQHNFKEATDQSFVRLVRALAVLSFHRTFGAAQNHARSLVHQQEQR